LEAGVRGWVFKSDGTDDLKTSVEALERDECTFSSRVSDLIMNGYLRRYRLGSAAAKETKLSPREREVLQLLGEGKSSKEVAVLLNVKVKTAETHRSNIMLKLNLHSIVELVLYAVRNEIVHVQLPAVAALSQPWEWTSEPGPAGP
jgi:DNA-binding NarL/FixJ family response regulator